MPRRTSPGMDVAPTDKGDLKKLIHLAFFKFPSLFIHDKLCYNKIMKTVIEVKDLVKVYGKRSTAFEALKGINLEIYEGESVAIVGKSGSGKSTLMHLLALLDKPTSGSVIIDGVNSSKLRNRQLNKLRNSTFGFVFQQFFMNPQDTVLANVILPLKIAKVRRKTRKNMAAKALGTVGLSDRIKFKANDLSGGQKQRVCIARAIVNHPKILFADEPTGNLDSVTGDNVIKLLFDLNKKKGVTLVIVTHDEDLAKLCDRQIHIADGRIIDDKSKKRQSRKSTTTRITHLTSKASAEDDDLGELARATVAAAKKSSKASSSKNTSAKKGKN